MLTELERTISGLWAGWKRKTRTCKQWQFWQQEISPALISIANVWFVKGSTSSYCPLWRKITTKKAAYDCSMLYSALFVIWWSQKQTRISFWTAALFKFYVPWLTSQHSLWFLNYLVLCVSLLTINVSRKQIKKISCWVYWILTTVFFFFVRGSRNWIRKTKRPGQKSCILGKYKRTSWSWRRGQTFAQLADHKQQVSFKIK